MRRCAAVPVGIVALALLAGCASAPASGRLDSALLPVAAAQCADRVALSSDASLSVDPLGWSIVSPGYTIETTALGSTVFGSRTGDAVRDVRSFTDCMSRTKVDYTLALADGTAQRLALYDWYRASLIPCLRRHGVKAQPLPDAPAFYAQTYGESDPYAAVQLADVGAALRLQADCPPAPPEVLVSAQALFGGRG